MKSSKLNKIIASFLTLFACFSIGYGSWNIHAEKSYSVGEKGDNPVAYIKNGTSKTYYLKLEKAVEAANKSDSKKSPIDVWVIPNTKYTVTSSFTIDEYVTLNLPFQDELNFDVYKTAKGAYDPNGAHTTSGVKAIDDPDTYRRTKLTLSSGVTITNNGTINVGGVIGGVGGGQEGACGQTCYYYSEIYCMGNSDGTAQIINNKLIKSQGNISGVSSQIFALENKANATFKSPFVVEENYGGSALVALGGGLFDALVNNLTFKCSPFNRIYMPNVTAKVQCDSGSLVYGLAAMYGDKAHNQIEVNIFGNKDAFFIQSNGGYLTSSFSNNCQTIDFYGDIGLNFLKMKITAKGIERSVKTDNVLFPISYVNDIRFHSIGESIAKVSSTQDIKILPGGKLFVDKNVNFSVSQLAVYDSSFEDPIDSASRYPKLDIDGIFKISGVANIEKLGGHVTIGDENAFLTIKSSASVVSKQILGKPGDVNYKDYTFDAKGVLSEKNGSRIYEGNFKVNKIYSSIHYSNTYSWPTDMFKNVVITAQAHENWKGYYFPKFNVYLAGDATDRNKFEIESLKQDTNWKVRGSNSTITKNHDFRQYNYIMIESVSNCHSITSSAGDSIAFGTWYKLNDTITITVTRTS